MAKLIQKILDLSDTTDLLQVTINSIIYDT